LFWCQPNANTYPDVHADNSDSYIYPNANRYVATVPDTYCNDYGYTRGQKYTKTTGSP
jgi:hypothetical protein